jgi:hypothetical protein
LRGSEENNGRNPPKYRGTKVVASYPKILKAVITAKVLQQSTE